MTNGGWSKLPEMRKELEILEDSSNQNGEKSWIIHDPLQHRYFQIDNVTKTLLSYWQNATQIKDIQKAFQAQTGKEVDEDEIAALIAFLRRNNLTSEDERSSWRGLSEQLENRRKTKLKFLPRSLIFFKVSLFHPQRLIQRALPFVEVLFCRTTLWVLGIMGLVGLYLASRQWDVFLDSLPGFLTPQGITILAIALFCLKALHELGHAFTAAHFGCRVPSMGIAFMLMTPMLYTDVTDAWRLSSRVKRMHISAAGLLTEFAVAIIATFLWVFLPDGMARTIAFVFATTGLITSVLINLNPLMRFDGYFIMSDWIGIDNLQARAFELGRWKLRQFFLSRRLDPPEKLPREKEWLLIIYAWLVWHYRLFLYFGMALFLYHFAFKLLGYVLFAAVFWMMLVTPISNEMRQWYNLLKKQQISAPRIRVLALGCLAILMAFVIPWQGRITIPAIAMTSGLNQVYPERAGRIIRINVKNGDKVAKGEPLFVINAPDLENEITATKIKLKLIKTKLARSQSDRDDLDERLVLEKQLEAIETQLQGLMGQKKHLTIIAPKDAIVLQVSKDIYEGRWIGEHDLLALISSDRKTTMLGYVGEAALPRLQEGQTGRFIPEGPLGSAIKVHLHHISFANSPSIEFGELTSVYGGDILVERNENKQLIPRNSQFKVELSPENQNWIPEHTIRGSINLKGKRESLALGALRQIFRTIIRESGI